MNAPISNAANASGLTQIPLSAAQLIEALEDLKQSRADRVDPIGYQLILSLTEKAEKVPAAAAQELLRRASLRLDAYQTELARAEVEAVTSLQRIDERFPASLHVASDCVERFDFSGLKRLERRLIRSLDQPSGQGDSLAALIASLKSEAPAVDKRASGLGFDEYLQQQDSELMLGLESRAAKAAPDATAEAMPAQPELKSARQLRQIQIREKAEKLVNSAIKDSPVSPGPLNPQMLAIRALKGMRDLSPQYLNRLVTYIDSLLWIETAGAKYAPEKRSKKGAKLKPGKTAR